MATPQMPSIRRPWLRRCGLSVVVCKLSPWVPDRGRTGTCQVRVEVKHIQRSSEDGRAKRGSLFNNGLRFGASKLQSQGTTD